MKRPLHRRGRAAVVWHRGFSGRPAARSYDKSLDALHGEHRPLDEDESFRLNAEAARAGMHDAVLAMGWYYLNGIGVERDLEQARFWYRKSARQGDPSAMYSLGIIEAQERRFELAVDWFRRAIAAGHDRSRFKLGTLYWHGRGVPPDRKEAMVLITEAARAKVPEAQRVLRFFEYRVKLARHR
jgi:TPR repeat protein